MIDCCRAIIIITRRSSTKETDSHHETLVRRSQLENTDGMLVDYYCADEALVV